MKNKEKIIILIFAVGSFISSCGTGEPGKNLVTTNYTINNVSNHNVELKVFGAYFDFVRKDTTFSFSSVSEISYNYINDISGAFGGGEDSSYIIFNNESQIIYRKDDGKVRNILDINSWNGGKVDDYLYKYEYFITDEDYENAVEIK